MHNYALVEQAQNTCRSDQKHSVLRRLIQRAASANAPANVSQRSSKRKATQRAAFLNPSK